MQNYKKNFKQENIINKISTVYIKLSTQNIEL